MCTYILSMYKKFAQIAFMGQVPDSVPVAQESEVHTGRTYGIVSFLAVNHCQIV